MNEAIHALTTVDNHVHSDDFPLPTRAQIVELQELMKAVEVPPPEPTHFFASGMYLRELTVQAGMRIVGKIHRHSHFLIVTKGLATVISEFGRETVGPGHISDRKSTRLNSSHRL